jgi:hypothetical protein
VSWDYVNDLKINGGIKINTFFEDFLIKEDKAYRLAQVMLEVDGVKQDFFRQKNPQNFIRDFVKKHLLPVKDFKHHEILVVTTGNNNGEIYSHAGAFVRRQIPSRSRSGFRVEVYYYDSN